MNLNSTSIILTIEGAEVELVVVEVDGVSAGGGYLVSGGAAVPRRSGGERTMAFIHRGCQPLARWLTRESLLEDGELTIGVVV